MPVARWRGFGGATDPQGPGFETFTWAAGIAGATRNSGVISTSHVALNHPIIAAKQSTVIDHISGGRYTLNIVNGWNFPEMEMFGVSLLEHEDRYACAEEWLTIVKRLWTRGRARSISTASSTASKAAICSRSRSRRRYPAIMNAGSSERGRHFACKHCDLVFTNIRSHDLATNTAPCRGLSQAGAREIRPRGAGVEQCQHRAGRDREGGARLLQLLRAREGRLGRRPQRHRHDGRPRSTSATIRRSGARPWPR